MQRRHLLLFGATAVLGGGALWWNRNSLVGAALAGRHNEGVALAPTPAPGAEFCQLTPSQEQGPFFFSAPLRSDVREDRDGQALALDLQVVDSSTCAPINGAVVELWHCDAAGRYSGYDETLSRRPFDTLLYIGGPDVEVPPENSKTFLRGAQVADAAGRVRFQTIVPGWYAPRMPHLHVKVFVQERGVLTTQIYFPGDLTDDLFASHPAYAPHGASPHHAGNDMVLGQYSDARGLLLQPRETANGLAAGALLGVG